MHVYALVPYIVSNLYDNDLAINTHACLNLSTAENLFTAEF